MKIRIVAAALAAGLALAACGSKPVGNPAPSAAPAPVAPAATSFRITPLYCGTFSAHQRNTYADFSGLIYRYTNTSTNGFTGWPVVVVNFTQGSSVSGQNETAAEPSIRPGESALADVGAVGDGGLVLPFTGCHPVVYVLASNVDNALPDGALENYPLHLGTIPASK